MMHKERKLPHVNLLTSSRTYPVPTTKYSFLSFANTQETIEDPFWRKSSAHQRQNERDVVSIIDKEEENYAV